MVFWRKLIAYELANDARKTFLALSRRLLKWIYEHFNQKSAVSSNYICEHRVHLRVVAVGYPQFVIAPSLIEMKNLKNDLVGFSLVVCQHYIFVIGSSIKARRSVWCILKWQLLSAFVTFAFDIAKLKWKAYSRQWF